jgi:beta-lactamase regulating signal transducer with metallopeptidase domain
MVKNKIKKEHEIMSKRVWLIFGFAFLLAISLFLIGCAASKSGNTQAVSTSPTVSSEGQQLLEQRCTVCHDLTRVKGTRKTKDNWQITVDRMVGKGARLNAEERTKVIDYLTETQKGI